MKKTFSWIGSLALGVWAAIVWCLFLMAQCSDPSNPVIP